MSGSTKVSGHVHVEKAGVAVDILSALLPRLLYIERGMADEDSFPWELLKADCLRLVCQQLLSQSELAYAFGKRDDMIAFLRDISTRGLEAAVSAVEETKNSQRTTTREGPSETKRKHTEDESVNDDDADNETPPTPTTPQAYNTRYKGVKRVKIWRDLPEGYSYTPLRRKPRKSAPAVLVSASGSNENAPPKRRRGRPPKSSKLAQISSGPSTSKRPGRPPGSRGKQVFDGVVMVQRPKKPFSSSVTLHESQLQGPLHTSPGGHHDPDADAEGEMDAEVEEAAAFLHPPLLENGVNGAVANQDVVGCSNAVNQENGNTVTPTRVASPPLSLSAIFTGHLDLDMNGNHTLQS